MLVGLVIVSLLVVMVLGVLAAFPLWSDQIMAFAGGEALAARPENLNVLRYFQVLSHLGLFVVPSLAFAWIISKSPMRYVSLNRRPLGGTLLLSAVIMLSALPLVGLLNQWNHQLSFPESMQSVESWMRQTEAAAEQMTKFFVLTDTWQGFLFNLFMIAMLPALGEELLFRGILQKLLHQWTRSGHVAVVVTAFLFSAMHMQFLSFLPRFALGMVLGYLFLYSGRLWIPIFAHFFNNAAALVVYLLFHRGVFPYDMEEIGAGTPGIFLGLASAVILAGLFVVFRRMGNKHHHSRELANKSVSGAVRDEGI